MGYLSTLSNWSTWCQVIYKLYKCPKLVETTLVRSHSPVGMGTHHTSELGADAVQLLGSKARGLSSPCAPTANFN